MASSSNDKPVSAVVVEVPTTPDTDNIEKSARIAINASRSVHSETSSAEKLAQLPTRRTTVSYFAGPRDLHHHSRFPLFMRLHGGILPKMVLPLSFVGLWATAVTLIDQKVTNIGVDTVLLTVLGFVVAFSVSFRSSTAYERYSEGRRYWAQLVLTARNLGRLIWLTIQEREDEEDPMKVKRDLINKIGMMNMISAFAVALKHHLRFEPGVHYEDLEPLLAAISGQTLASQADQEKLKQKEPSTWKQLGEKIGFSFAESNPRKLIKRSQQNLGNLPHEILSHLQGSISNSMATRQIAHCHKFFWTDMRAMNDVLAGVERILNTPLPLAYTISIAQITWMYIMVLPFQLVNKLSWVTIPATMLSAYIILGLAMIGQEIENPFGMDVNDLPLEQFCEEIQADLDVLMSMPMAEWECDKTVQPHRPLFPTSFVSSTDLMSQDMSEVRALLKAKAQKRTTVTYETV